MMLFVGSDLFLSLIIISNESRNIFNHLESTWTIKSAFIFFKELVIVLETLF